MHHRVPSQASGPGARVRSRFDLDLDVPKILAGDRSALGRGITLVESRLPSDRSRADALLERLLPRAGHSHRVGITGMPGVGKSTLIDELGQRLIGRGHRVAVLAVDPSSTLSGGSILGDKTRMHRLALDPRAFIRPSPSGGVLGGVARRTRETIVLVEAAGYDVVLVETVGVGQSEVMVANMVDFFLVLTLTGGGDELQGIKRGILELADRLVVTKADGDNLESAHRASAEYARALALLPPRDPSWRARVQVCSALDGSGIDALWEAVQSHRRALMASGAWERARAQQRLHWLWQSIRDGLQHTLEQDESAGRLLSSLEPEVREGSTSPEVAAAQVLAAFLRR